MNFISKFYYEILSHRYNDLAAFILGVLGSGLVHLINHNDQTQKFYIRGSGNLKSSNSEKF